MSFAVQEFFEWYYNTREQEFDTPRLTAKPRKMPGFLKFKDAYYLWRDLRMARGYDVGPWDASLDVYGRRMDKEWLQECDRRLDHILPPRIEKL